MRILLRLAVVLSLILPVPAALSLPKHRLNKQEHQQLICLAKNVYYEARGEPLQGQLAVAQVTLNRVQANFGDNVCEVVYAPKQFSWTHQKRGGPLEADSWDRALQVSYRALYQKQKNRRLTKALYYHNTTVKPRWSKKKQPLTKIGAHIFYA